MLMDIKVLKLSSLVLVLSIFIVNSIVAAENQSLKEAVIRALNNLADEEDVEKEAKEFNALPTVIKGLVIKELSSESSALLVLPISLYCARFNFCDAVDEKRIIGIDKEVRNIIMELYLSQKAEFEEPISEIPKTPRISELSTKAPLELSGSLTEIPAERLARIMRQG